MAKGGRTKLLRPLFIAKKVHGRKEMLPDFASN